MPDSTPVTRAFAALNIPHRLFRHPGPVHSLEQAARERGQSPDQVVRSIVFRVGQGEYVMVLVAGARQVSWPALRRYLGQSRLTMASEAEVLAATGYERGAVSPFGLPAPMRILLDESVLAAAPQEISLGSAPGFRAGVKSRAAKTALSVELQRLEEQRDALAPERPQPDC